MARSVVLVLALVILWLSYAVYTPPPLRRPQCRGERLLNFCEAVVARRERGPLLGARLALAVHRCRCWTCRVAQGDRPDLGRLRLVVELDGMRRVLHDHLTIELWSVDHYLVGSIKVETLRRIVVRELEGLLFQAALARDLGGPHTEYAKPLLEPHEPPPAIPERRPPVRMPGFSREQRQAFRARRRSGRKRP